MTAHLSRAPAGGWRTEITRMQWLVLLGTTLGWALDGFAGSLYALVLGPAMTELLPNSDITPVPANIGLYGGLTVALFLAGWATGGILFGMLADYFGRTRVLSIGILTYAVFTAAAAFADTWWQLGILRFIAGLGSGVEAPVGAALIAEVWRNRYRAKACGVMMSGYAAGFFIAALAYAILGTQGWRFMLGLAVVPAILVWFIRRYVPEPPEITTAISARRARKQQGQQTEQDRFVLRRLLTPPFLRSTLICTALATGSLIAFWSVSTWYPQIIRLAAAADSLSVDQGNHRVAMASLLFNAGGVLGYASWGFIADAIGRRKAFAISFLVSAVSVVYLFPFERSYTEFLVAMPVIGFGLFGALSGTFVYGPEIFPPSVRATGMALANSVGRYITAAGPLIAGVIAVSWFGGDLGMATTSVAAFGLIALVGLAFAPETRGAALPTDPTLPPDPAPAEGGTVAEQTVSATTAEEPLMTIDNANTHSANNHSATTYSGARAIVIGGSIGGLTTALLLKDLGFDVKIFERTPTVLDGRGSGIVLQPDTLRWFTERSTQNPARLSTSTRWVQYLDGTDRIVHREERTWSYTAWGTFYRALLDDFGLQNYVLGEFAAGFEQHEQSATVRFVSGRTETADLVVFADGITSMARTRLDPTATMTYSGYVGWRGTVPEHTLSTHARETLADAISYTVVPHSHITMYPIPGEHGVGPQDRLMNYVWYRNVAAGPELAEMLVDKRGFTGPVSIHPGQVQDRYVAEMRAAAADLFGPAIAEVVTATATPYVQVVQDVRSSKMADGRVALIGDAACAARPHAAAGTAKAAADGWALHDALQQAQGDIRAALRKWEPAQLALSAALLDRVVDMGERAQFRDTWTPGDPSLRFGLYGPGR